MRALVKLPSQDSTSQQKKVNLKSQQVKQTNAETRRQAWLEQQAMHLNLNQHDFTIFAKGTSAVIQQSFREF
jgi:hypothetical protein